LNPQSANITQAFFHEVVLMRPDVTGRISVTCSIIRIPSTNHAALF
jgi:hypothetical protein